MTDTQALIFFEETEQHIEDQSRAAPEPRCMAVLAHIGSRAAAPVAPLADRVLLLAARLSSTPKRNRSGVLDQLASTISQHLCGTMSLQTLIVQSLLGDGRGLRQALPTFRNRLACLSHDENLKLQGYDGWMFVLQLIRARDSKVKIELNQIGLSH